MDQVIREFSTDKVYTFCLWGVSKFLDVMRWEVVGGIIPGAKLDFNKLCGAPPVNISIYELDSSKAGTDKRHLTSYKRHLFKAAVWSTKSPPGAQQLKEQSADVEVSDWYGMAGTEHLLA